jgi:hypothetical protein
VKSIRTLAFLFLALCAGTATKAQTISAADAGNHIGQTATVCGIVASERTAKGSRGTPTFINLDSAYPSEVFTILVWGQDRPNVGVLPRVGSHTCVVGTIQSYRGIPEIIVKSSAQFRSQTPSGGHYYTNSDGQRIHSPVQAASVPAGATAQCRDGSYSFSQHRQGTCSHHGGVAQWLQ